MKNNFLQRKSISIENLYEVEINQANQVIQQIEKENSFDIEQTLSDIEQGQIFEDELDDLHLINQQQIDLIRKTISHNYSVSFLRRFSLKRNISRLRKLFYSIED